MHNIVYRMVGTRARGIKCAPPVKDMTFSWLYPPSWIPMFNMTLGTVHAASTTTKKGEG